MHYRIYVSFEINREEEVQGLVRYIYTGQLSAPRIHGSSWEKIIGDFKVGSPLESDDDLASIHELTDYGESSPVVSHAFHFVERVFNKLYFACSMSLNQMDHVIFNSHIINRLIIAHQQQEVQSKGLVRR